MPIAIRPTMPDHPQVQALLAELDAYLASLYAPEDNHILELQALRDPSVTFLAAWDGERAIGCGAVRAMAGEPASGDLPYGEVKRMMVAPARRGEGVASAILDGLETSLRDAGVERAMLETGRDQHAAVRLYTRHGYAVRAAFGGYPDNGLSLFMEKRWDCR